MNEAQRFASTRPDVLVYQTAPLTDDITVAGDIKPSLYISSSNTDSEDDYKYPDGMKPPDSSAFSVFQPGGYQMLLRGEPFPPRFRNSFEKPVPLVPNQVAKIQYTMPGITHTFKREHWIMAQIQST